MPNPRRVLLMSHQLNLGGTERQLTEIAKALDREKFQAHVGCFHDDGIRARELREAGIPILRLPVSSYLSPTALQGALQLIRYIHRNAIDIVHTFDVPLNVFGVPTAWISRRPIVISSQRAHRSLTPGVYHRLLRLTDSLVDATVVNCEYMRRHLEQEERVAANKIHLCYNGLDLKTFRRIPGPKPPELASATLVIGVVCALRPEKDVSTLIEAFAQVRQQGMMLAIVGSGPCLAALQDRARELGVADSCVFAPTTDRIPVWLNAFDIFVLPSLSEALSNSLMEAMACGCCVVATKVGGNPELIGEEQERGLAFAAGDSEELAAQLKKLIASPELRLKLAEAGRKFIRQDFSIDQAARRMEQIYEGLLKG